MWFKQAIWQTGGRSANARSGKALVKQQKKGYGVGNRTGVGKPGLTKPGGFAILFLTYRASMCRRGSVVEQLFRKQQVTGSNPVVGLTLQSDLLDSY